MCIRDRLVHFFSVQVAYFVAPSTELAAQQQRLRQLPPALASNKVASEAAEQRAEQDPTAELAEVGALHMERH